MRIRGEMGLKLYSQTQKYDCNASMTILHAFEHHFNFHWKRTVLNYYHFTESSTGSWRLIFTRDDRMRAIRLENKCESSYRSEGCRVGSLGHVYSRPTSKVLMEARLTAVCCRRAFMPLLSRPNVWARYTGATPKYSS